MSARGNDTHASVEYDDDSCEDAALFDGDSFIHNLTT